MSSRSRAVLRLPGRNLQSSALAAADAAENTFPSRAKTDAAVAAGTGLTVNAAVSDPAAADLNEYRHIKTDESSDEYTHLPANALQIHVLQFHLSYRCYNRNIRMTPLLYRKELLLL